MAPEAVAAGYFGVVPGAPPSWLDAKYTGRSLVSLDRELVAMVPGARWMTSRLADELLAVGVPESELEAASAWLDDAWFAGDLLFPNVFGAPSVVATFLDRFAPQSGAVLLGVALDGDEVDAFLAEHDRRIAQADGIIEVLRREEPLAAGYRSLGYEPLEVTRGGFGNSWTIHNLQPAVEAATGVAPNGAGFLSTREEARAVMAYLLQPDVPKEPGIWRAWRLVEYPRRSCRPQLGVRHS